MKRFHGTIRIVGLIAMVVAGISSVAPAQDRQAVPREGAEKPATQPPERERRPPDADQRRAHPRDDRDRRESGRTDPPRRAGAHSRHYFTPVDVRVRFYYHPYFGFYYGPYYGPYYPGHGSVALVRFNEGAIRLKVKPVDAEVYVNGYYAGIVDDFDGILQRLYVPRGEHEITLRLRGYESHTVPVRVRSGQTIDVAYQMHRLPAGRPDSPPPARRPLPREWSGPPSDGELSASPFGILALRTDPSDAQLVIDGEAWAPVAGQAEFVIHLMAGWHQIEVRQEGYEPFSTRLELLEGQTVRLEASLRRRP